MTVLRSAALSDIGRVRRENEDRLVHEVGLQAFGVADGIGGLPSGADAAQRAVEEVLAGLRAVPPGTEPDLAAIARNANQRVCALGAELSPTVGLGCTLTFGSIRGAVLTIAHVGDSRCYGWRNGELLQLTDDHSVENEARMRRARGEVVYYHEADRNALTRCIGQPGTPKIDLIRRPLQAGDRYLFCTDGVTRLVRQGELAELMSVPGEPADLLAGIIALALRRGGPDNASGVLVFVDAV